MLPVDIDGADSRTWVYAFVLRPMHFELFAELTPTGFCVNFQALGSVMTNKYSEVRYVWQLK